MIGPLYIKDNETGRVHKIGTDRHDSLVINECKTITYYNLQCGDGSMYGTYTFCNPDGSDLDSDWGYDYVGIGADLLPEPQEGVLPIRFSVDEGGFEPTRAHDADAGIDLRTPETFDVFGGQCVTIDTKTRFEIPEGYCGLIVSKSGLMVNHMIETTGLIDSGYSGTVRVEMYKRNGGFKHFEKGDKISQIVILPIPSVRLIKTDHIDGGERGSNGFGSSGR